MSGTITRRAAARERTCYYRRRRRCHCCPVWNPRGLDGGPLEESLWLLGQYYRSCDPAMLLLLPTPSFRTTPRNWSTWPTLKPETGRKPRSSSNRWDQGRLPHPLLPPSHRPHATQALLAQPPPLPVPPTTPSPSYRGRTASALPARCRCCAQAEEPLRQKK